MSLTTLPRVATNVYLDCLPSCDREGSYHKILAHTSSTSAKTQCEICGKKRTLKLDTKRPATAVRSSARAKTSATAGQKQFQALVDQFGPEAATYSIKGSFSKDTLIEHPKFGRGVVTLSYENKLQVLFRDGVRELVHNRK